MNVTVFFQICSLLYFVMLLIVFNSKQKLKSIETRFYSSFLVVNFIGLIVDIYLALISKYMSTAIGLYKIVAKLYLIYFVTYIAFLCMYMYIVSHNKKTIKTETNKLEKYFKIFALTYIFNIIVIILSPNYFEVSNQGTHSYGLATTYTYICAAIYITLSIIFMLQGRKNTKFKKYIPNIIFITLTAVTMIIQIIYPDIFLQPTAMTLAAFVMYFTIENPDMKLLEEVNKSKKISDTANEEKTLFLYNITQELRKTIEKINLEANNIADLSKDEEAKNAARNILLYTGEFSSITNNILDTSSMTDEKSIKIYKTKYNIKNIIKELITSYDKKCKEKDINFISNIDNNIPEFLYGDYITLKEVLIGILNNSLKHTNSGYIELNINTIIKNDICRLIITIEDSGIGIKSEELNKVKITGKELSKINSKIISMEGAMVISSNYGIGTKIKIILDEKIVETIDKDIKDYEEITKNVSLLMIDDSEASLKIINKLLKDTNTIMDSTKTGKEAINLLKVNKYDLIFLDEELNNIKGRELLIKIKEIRNFKTNVILLTKDNNYEYNDKYLKEGFADYLLKPIKRESILEKINKYAKK